MAANHAPASPRRRLRLALLASAALLGACANTSDHAPPSADQAWTMPQPDPAWRELAEQGPLPAVPDTPAEQAGNSTAGTLPARILPDPAHIYDLPELVDLAQRNNPATRLAWNQARQAANAIGMADATFLPMITAYVVGGYQSTRQRLPDILNQTFHLDTSAHGVVPLVALEWLLFDFGERSAARDAARNLATGSNFLFNSVHQAIIFETMSAYYQYGTAQERNAIARESLDNSLAVEKAVQAKRKAGLATSVEEAQARQQVAQARLAVVSTGGAVRNARQALMSVLNLEPDTPLQVSDSVRLALPAPQELPDGAVLRRALANRPDIMASIASLKAAESAVDGARAAFMPKVFLAAAYANGHGDLDIGNLPALSRQGPTRGVLVGVSIPLYDGGMRSSRLRQAHDGVQAAQAALEKLRNTSMKEIALAANALDTALQSYEAAATLVETAGITYNATLEAYKVGMGTVTAATEAANGLLIARSARADAQAAAQIAAASLAFALGQLNSAEIRLQPPYAVPEARLPAAAPNAASHTSTTP